MTAPTPLPDRVGARVRRWAGPSIAQERAGFAVRLELAADDEPARASVARGLDLA